MKKFLFAFTIALLTHLSVSAQSSYILHHIKSNADRTIYEKALDKAHLDTYRFVESRVTMTFDDGVEVELLSGREMRALGLPANLSVMHTTPPADSYKPPVFHINQDGMIIAMYKPVYKHR